MKIRKRTYGPAVALCFLLFTGLLPSTGREYKGKALVKPELAARGDSLHIDLTVELDGLSIEPERSLTLTPVLASGTILRSLPPVVINGRHRHRLYRRYQTLNGEGNTAGVVEVVNRKKADPGQQVRYHAALRYEEWMKTASLDIVEELCGCAGHMKETSVTRLVASVDKASATATPEKFDRPERITPYLSYVQVSPGYPRDFGAQTEVRLDFGLASAEIRPDYRDNKEELGKIGALIEELQSDKRIVIKKIAITGYASPDGSLELNLRLSEGRAKALQEYMLARFDCPEDIYTVRAGGEDWSGLEEMIRASDMDYKHEALDIIANYPVKGGREGALMKLAGGEPYRYMAQQMFPGLRKTLCVCAIEYEVKSRTPEEAGEILRTRPQDLSLRELYEAAAALEPGSPVFGDIMDLAVQRYPDDPVVNLNAAAAALEAGRTDEAARYLEKAEPFTAEYMNNRGVMEMLLGNCEQARTWLEKAKENGSEPAGKNLAELEKNTKPRKGNN